MQQQTLLLQNRKHFHIDRSGTCNLTNLCDFKPEISFTPRAWNKESLLLAVVDGQVNCISRSLSLLILLPMVKNDSNLLENGLKFVFC